MTGDERIRFVDLAAQHAEVADEVAARFATVLDATAFIAGPQLAEFESEYAHFAETRHCIGVANGTDALELALRAAHIGVDDEVILPTNSFVATAAAVVRAGARPVFVDCDPEFGLIDVDQVASRLTARTRSVVPVHLYGQMAPMADLADVLGGHDDVVVVEDTAQAHGARQGDLVPGRAGIAAGVSFYPGKNLGAYGDAGAVLTDDDVVAHRVRLMRDHGSVAKYQHEIVGWNSRTDTLQACVLAAKLPRLEGWNEHRRQAAARYDELLAGIEGVTLPRTAPGNVHVWHLYTVRLAERDQILAALQDAAIEAGIHYPTPIHLMPGFVQPDLGVGSFPNAETAASQLLSLPIHPHLTPAQQERVADTFRRALKDAR